MALKRCRDVEHEVFYLIGRKANPVHAGEPARMSFRDPNFALLQAADAALHGHERVELAVVARSERGAACWGGEEAVARYRRNPRAGVLARYGVRVTPKGR
jgi:hypothetical protein